MTNNIEIATLSVKPDVFHAEFLVAHAAEIRRLGKRLITDVIEIGRHLTEVRTELRETVGHGHFHAWTDREFGWSDRTTLNFMRVYELSLKSETVSDLNLPMRELYLLAAPGTPEEAVNEIIERAAAGEPVSGAEVKEAISRARPGTVETGGTENAESADDADHADHAGDDHHVGGDDHAEEPASPEPKADLETLSAVWEMSTPEEQQDIRDRVLADFFAQATGAHIAAFIPTPKHADVVRPLLDQLGVDGMLQAMSIEFGRRLRAKLPRKAKRFKTARAVKTTDANGKATYALKGRGSRSRPQA